MNLDIKNKLFKILSADFSAKIILAVISLSLIRLMSTEDFALYTVIFTAINLISSLIASVINKLYIVGKFEEDGYNLTNFLSFQILLVIIITLLLIPASSLFEGHLVLMFAIILLKVFMVFIQTHFQKRMEFRRYYKLEYLRIGIYTLLFILLFFSRNFISVFEILAINLVSLIIAGCYFGIRLIKINELFDIKKTISLLTKTLNSEFKYLYFYSIGILLLVNIDVFMLRLLDDSYQVAIFGAAFTFYSFLMLGLGAVHKLFLPLINSIESVEKIRETFRQHKKISLYLIPLLVVGLLASKFIIPLIDGGKYPESILIFQVLSVSAYFSFLLSPYANVILKFKEFKFIFVSVFIAILIHVIANFLVIPRFHAIGLAWANLFIYALFNYVVYLKSTVLLKPNNK